MLLLLVDCAATAKSELERTVIEASEQSISSDTVILAKRDAEMGLLRSVRQVSL